MEIYLIVILILATLFGFYMAWGIGANDVANAMGTSVGSGALTLKQAVIVAAVFEFSGAVLAGMHVSETVRKGIVDPAIFAGDGLSFMLGMLAALLAAGVQGLAGFDHTLNRRCGGRFRARLWRHAGDILG